MKISEYVYKQFKKSLFIEMMLKQPRVLLENKGMLLERHGILNNLEMYMKRFRKFLNQNKDLQGQSFILEDNIFEKIPDCFFNEIRFDISWGKGVGCDGGTASNVELDTNGKLKCVDIQFTLRGSTWDSLVESAGGVLAHELTHAYEMYQRLIKGGKSSYDELLDSNYVDTIELKRNPQNPIEKAMSHICYYLFNFEVNAYVASVYSNLLQVAPSWTTPDEGLAYLEEHDRTFKNYLVIGDYIDILQQFEEMPEVVENAWVKAGKAPLPFNKIITKICAICDKRLHRLRRTLAKIIYDVYMHTRDIRTSDTHEEQ